MKLDLRVRCLRCNALKPVPRGPATKMRAEQFERYAPYCSYHCQEWGKLEDAYRNLPSDDDMRHVDISFRRFITGLSVLGLALLCACTGASTSLDRDAVRDLLAAVIPADAPRALPVAMGDASTDAAPISSYAYLFGQRTATSAHHLAHALVGSPVCYGLRTGRQTRTLPYYRGDGCFVGEPFVVSWTLNVGRPPGPWPRPAWVLALRLPRYVREEVEAARAPLPLDAFGVPGVTLPFVPQMSFECGNSLGLVEHDASGRVVLRWTPPEVAAGSVWMVALLWHEPTGLMVSRALEWRVGRRP